MAPDDERPTNRNCPWENDDNPFAAFRRYADEAMASVLQGFIGLPSTFNFPNPNERWIPFDEQARRRAIESWEGQLQDGKINTADGHTPREAAQHPGRALGHPPPSYHGLEPPFKPYVPREHPNSPGRFYPWGPFDFDFFSYRNTHQPMADWVLQYLQNSSYSPRNLETMQDMGRFGLAWRRAFEDLLDAEYGKELKARESRNRLGNAEHALDWAWKMSRKSEQYERGDGDRGSVSRAPQSDEQAREFSELDMYEQFLGKDFGPEKPQENDSSKPTETSNSSSKTHQLGIISTLTTTERVILPDGTTNTKVVLKKRFSDGREETSESVHTTHGKQKETSPGSIIPQASKSEHIDDQKNKDKKEKNGWFWT